MRCFTATYENKKISTCSFLLSTLAPHLTELSKDFQAGYFNFAQMKASVKLCINKLSGAAGKSELKAIFPKSLIVNLGNLERRLVVCQVAWRFERAPRDWQIDHLNTHKGRLE